MNLWAVDLRTGEVDLERPKEKLLDYIDAAGSERPLFTAGAINAWSWSPTDVVELVQSLPDSITVVQADKFFDLFAQS